MNWISIGLAALSGALAAVIATLLIRNPKKKRSAYLITLAISFIIINGLSREYISPVLDAWNSARKAESILLKIPIYQVIKQYDPKTYENLLSIFKNGLQKGIDESLIMGQMRGHITGLVKKRLSYASDEAVVSYINVMVTEMRELNMHGGDLCYRFLFPQHSEPIAMEKYISKQTQEADVAALAQVIRTSAESPQSIPREAEVMPKLEFIYLELEKKYGRDILILQNPTVPNVDRTKVCSMAADLYARILKLPPNESGKIIRFMLSQE